MSDARRRATCALEASLGTPQGLVPDVGGPRIYTMAELIRTYLRATGKHRPVMPLPIPGNSARAVRAGAILTPDRAVGHRSWEEFLAERLNSPGDVRPEAA